jgi:Na+/proline symporter
MKAFLLNLYIPLGANPLIIALHTLTSPFVFALCILGLIAAITSTADSLLCAVSSHFSQDFDFSRIGFIDKLVLSKAITFITGIIVLTASFLVKQDIIDILIESYTLAVSCLFVPLLFVFFKKNLNKYAAIGAMTCGFISFVFFLFYKTPVPHGILPLTFSFIGYGLGSLYQPKRTIQNYR